ncbi:MAG: WG repeat-containing protein [Flavobacterium sp.]|uniref:WG repeat-containing protein n=1 Tax=Flavobacterium sp. TaxID=239 RepID=UPI0022BE1D8F|nr:WG repeat-containing protein [Flavobacterium sp.]MCZ8298361.1 WG repeat-containing protein [Flavobacterium sp.]
MYDYNSKQKIISNLEQYINGNKCSFKIEKDLLIINFSQIDLKKIINLGGKFITEGKFDKIEFFEDIKIKNNHYSSFIISNGDKCDVLIPGIKNKYNLYYDEVDYINEDTIIYKKNNLYGMLNFINNFVIEPFYYEIKQIKSRNTSFYELIDEISSKVIDFKGNIILDNETYKNIFYNENNFYVTIEENGKYKLYDLFSKKNLLLDFEEITKISYGSMMFCVKNKNKVKYIDFENNRETQYDYDDIIFKNKIVNRFEYNKNKRFHFERIKVSKNSKFGFLNQELEEVVKCIYDTVENFTISDDDKNTVFANVCLNNKWNKININGNNF